MITVIPMELVHTFGEPVELDGRKFVARVFGDEQWDGCWHAYIAFFARGKRGLTPLATDRDCVAPNRTALGWWAAGLTDDYLKHALRRALHLEANPDERIDTAPTVASERTRRA